MVYGGYSGFIAPATSTVYNFIKLDNGVMTTIRHPFRNVRSTLKLILYLFLFVLLLCKLSGRDGSEELKKAKLILKNIFNRLKDSASEEGFITKAFTDIRPILVGAASTLFTNGSSLFDRVTEMFTGSKSVVSEAAIDENKDEIERLKEELKQAKNNNKNDAELAKIRERIAAAETRLSELLEKIAISNEEEAIAKVKASTRASDLAIKEKETARLKVEAGERNIANAKLQKETEDLKARLFDLEQKLRETVEQAKAAKIKALEDVEQLKKAEQERIKAEQERVAKEAEERKIAEEAERKRIEEERKAQEAKKLEEEQGRKKKTRRRR